MKALCAAVLMVLTLNASNVFANDGFVVDPETQSTPEMEGQGSPIQAGNPHPEDPSAN